MNFYRLEMLNLLGRFAVGGIISTIIAYFSLPVIFTFLLHLVKDMNPSQFIQYRDVVFDISYILAVFINVSSSFYLQKKVVFQSSRKWFFEYLRFWIGASGIGLISYFALLWLKNILGLNIFVSNAIVVSLSSIVSFVFHYMITFSGERK